MTAKKTLSAPNGGGSSFNPWSMAADFGRQQLTVATESAAAMVRGLDAMRKVQEQAGRQAMARHFSLLSKLSQASHPAQLMALQSELLSLDAQGPAHYWQEMSAAALEMQTEIVSCCSHLVDSEAVLQATSAMNGVRLPLSNFNAFFGRPVQTNR